MVHRRRRAAPSADVVADARLFDQDQPLAAVGGVVKLGERGEVQALRTGHTGDALDALQAGDVVRAAAVIRPGVDAEALLIVARLLVDEAAESRGRSAAPASSW